MSEREKTTPPIGGVFKMDGEFWKITGASSTNSSEYYVSRVYNAHTAQYVFISGMGILLISDMSDLERAVFDV